MLEYLSVEKQEISKSKLLLYILIAYGVNIVIKMILYYQVMDNPEYFYNGSVIPLWTADSGLYGFYANQLIEGSNYPLISEYMPAYFLYWIHGLTGISIDNLLYFAPIFLSSLIIVPAILIANIYRFAYIGLYAAMIGGVTTSYYYRTHLGYYDTDILNVFFPFLSITFLIYTIESKRLIYSLITFVILVLFTLWYHVALPINLSIILIFLTYILLFDRKNTMLYQALIIISISILPLSLLYKFIAVVLIYIGFVTFHRYPKIDYRYYLGTLFISIIVAVTSIDSSKYTTRVMDYVDKKEFIEVQSSEGSIVKFKSDLDTVAEARSVELFFFSHQVSGTILFFILATIGYIILLIRYKSFILTLPLVIFMFASMFVGFRFSIYGVMIYTFSLIFAIYIFRNILIKYVEYSSKISNAIIYTFIVVIAFYHINNILQYNQTRLKPASFVKTEDITQIKYFASHVNKKSFMINWWDDSWPLWYYTNIKTLIDNGKHQQDNYIVSKILLSDNQEFVKNASIFFTEKFFEGRGKGYFRVMDYFLREYSVDVLDEMASKEFTLPQRKKETFIFLHREMVTKLTFLESFSNIDLSSGQQLSSNILGHSFLRERLDNSKDKVLILSGSIDISNGILELYQKRLQIASLSSMEQSKLKMYKEYPKSSSDIHVVIDGGLVLLMTQRMYQSFFIQAFYLNNYDGDKFEKVAATKNFMILKVK